MIYAAIFLYWAFSAAVFLYCCAISFDEITIGDIFKAVFLAWIAWWFAVLLTIDLKGGFSSFEKSIWSKK